MALLIDISNNNGTPDWGKVKAFGVQGVFLKATEGLGFTDKTFAQRRADANKNALPVGAYHFAHPETSPTAQAQKFASVVGKVNTTDLRPVLDLEVATKLPASAVVTWARAWNQEVKRLLGVLPLFYSYSAYIQGLHASTPIGAGLWLAAYGRNDGAEYPYDVPPPWKKAVAHQFTSAGKVPGCQGPVDLSHAGSMAPLQAHPVRRAVASLPYLGRH